MNQRHAVPDFAVIVTNFAVDSSVDTAVHSDEITDQVVRLMLTGLRFPGFWSGEIIPASAAEPDIWRVVLWFESAAQAAVWRQSVARHEVITQLTSSPAGAGITISEGDAKENTSVHVATAIVTDVRPGREADFCEWSYRIKVAQAKQPGFRGTYFQAPGPGQGTKWATLIRFDSPEALESWFASEERQELLKQSEDFVRASHVSKVPTSFPGWFPTDQVTGQSPSKWKTSLMVLLGLYPIVVTQAKLLGPIVTHLPRPVALIITLPLSVPLVTWVAMPFLIRVFSWWLLPKGNELSTNIKGVIIVVALLAAQVGLFLAWN